MKSNNHIKWLTRTGLLLAITVLWQSLRLVIGVSPVSTYIIGSLVNLTLIVATCTVGFASGAAVALLAPLIAFAQGFAQPFMVPFLILGNLSLATIFGLLKNINWSIKAILTASAKFLIIGVGFILMFLNKPDNTLTAAFAAVLAQQGQQFVTVIIGSIVALPIIHGINSAVKK